MKMPNADERVLMDVISFLERQKIEHEESEEQYCTKVNARSGPQKASISVYNSGKMSVQGPASQLKTLLEQMKQALESGAAAPGQTLPFEIELFPQTIRERVVDCDPVIIGFVEEAIRCYKADALLGCAFMIGAASERAIGLLIQAFGESITDEPNRNKYFSKINGRMISARYDEFETRYRSCKSRPTDPVLSQDLDVVIGNMFQFCRITRNEVGHPQIVPDLVKGVLLANLGHFVSYMERIYGLIRHFKSTGVVL
ncbi:MAG: hypothetical protein AAB403_10815 [Planctomycetota bacterium]